MTKFELNQVDVKGDGRIILYQRPDVKHPKWQCRISVSGSTGYKIFSTKESELRNAERVALEKYEELYFKVRRGGSLTGIPFTTVFKEWKIHHLSDPTRHKEFQVTQVEKLGVKYFKTKPIDEITDKHTLEMMDWFKNQPVEHINKSQQLTPSTIRSYRAAMNNIFKYAKTKGYIENVPEIPAPALDGNRRPDFSLSDWTTLTTYMRKWVDVTTNGLRGKNGLDHKRYRERFYLQQYILIMGNTGIRVGEMRNCRWVDLSKAEITSGDERLLFAVDGKTGKRNVVGNTGVQRYVKNLWEFRCNELGHNPEMTEPLFCHPDGSRVGTYKKGFNQLLEECNLRIDKDGQNRTIYSLRHTYATMRINEVSIYQLAVNMGTGVEMIERFYSHARTTDPVFLAAVTKGNQTTKDKALPF